MNGVLHNSVGVLAGGRPVVVVSGLLDHFADTDGTRVNAHAMDVGGGWTEDQGVWVIQSNRAILSAGAGDGQCVVTADAGVADAPASVIVTTPASGTVDVGLIFNAVDATNYWLFAATSSIGYRLFRRVAGTFTQVGSIVSQSFSAATAYTLSVVTAGDTVTCSANGAQKFNQTVASRPLKTATRFGFRAWSGNSPDAGSTFDEFSVTP